MKIYKCYLQQKVIYKQLNRVYNYPLFCNYYGSVFFLDWNNTPFCTDYLVKGVIDDGKNIDTSTQCFLSKAERVIKLHSK